ncbi:MAG: glucose-6-phosphate isomerase, partial [Caldimonas sp.]
DGADLAGVLAAIEPRETLFVVASKTFTTQETMANAATAKAWFLAAGEGARIDEHFVAATTNVEAAAQFGIATTFGFRDWVGGRYSLWSAIGLPIAIALGAGGFRELLAGAHAMDEHFAHTPVEKNLPMLLGLVDVWYRNFHRFTSRSVAPYSHALKRLPAYLQQLEMESNGKSVDQDGAPLPFATSPVVWGEPGTNGQHAYFQMLHQGSDVIPVEFILVRRAEPARPWPAEVKTRLEAQHRMLLANGLAQAQALMQGQAAEPHRTFAGNRPSTTLLLEALTPHSLGALLAMYEHRVFTSGAVWSINSFDQWGVELGKTLGARLLPLIEDGTIDGTDLDGSTAGLLRRLRG